MMMMYTKTHMNIVQQTEQIITSMTISLKKKSSKTSFHLDPFQKHTWSLFTHHETEIVTSLKQSYK